MQGDDVADVQRQLRDLGYEVGVVDGVFGSKLKLAVRAFQTDYDITNDGVLGNVSVRALNYLKSQGVTEVSPASAEQRHWISFIARANPRGLVLIDLVSRQALLGDATEHREANRLVGDLGRRVEQHLGSDQNQVWLLTAADFSADEKELANFANDVRAPLFISLGLVASSAPGGCATYHFASSAEVYSHIGRPLAASIQAEVVRSSGAPDLGVHGEESVLFERAELPTVRLNFGNLRNASDRRSLADPEYLESVAVGVAAGVRRFYVLGADDPILYPLDVNSSR